MGVEPILSALGDERLCGSSSSSFTVVAAQRGLRTMYLYFFQLHAFGSGGALTLFWRNQRKDSQLCQFVRKLSLVLELLHFSELTARFLLQVLDSAGEFGWQLERAGLSGDGVPIWGDSGSPFSTFDPGWQFGKAPGLRELPTSSGSLWEKQRKCCHELVTQQQTKVNKRQQQH